MRRLAIDIDGCIANFCKGFGQLLTDVTGKDLFPEGWANNTAFPPVWNWDIHAGYTLGESKQAWNRVKAHDQFWYDLEPLPLAVETIGRLNTLSKEGHEVYFLTNRLGVRCKRQTELWLSSYGMTLPTVIIVADKMPVLRALRIDAFGDDRLDTVNEVARVIEEEELPLHVYLRDAPYNKEGRRNDLVVVESVKEMLLREGLWW